MSLRLKSQSAVTLAVALLLALVAQAIADPEPARGQSGNNANDQGLRIAAHVLAQSGEPMAGGTARLSLVRSSPEESRLIPVASETLTAGGYLDLEVPSTELADTRMSQLELEVLPVDDGPSLLFNFTATRQGDGTVTSTIPSGSTLQAMQGLLSPSEAAPPGARARRSSATNYDEGLVGLAEDAELGEDYEESVPADDETEGMELQGGRTSCSQEEITSWFRKGKYRYAYVPTKYIRTTSRAKFTWDLGRTHETSMELSYNYAGSHVSGGLVASRGNTSGISYRVTAPATSTKIFKVKWKFQLERKACRRTVPGTSPWHQIAVTRWYPVEPLVGTVLKDTDDTFACAGTGPAYADNIAVRTTVASSSDVNLRGFFSVAGVTLNANQVDSSSQVFTVEPRGRPDARVCGYDDTPRYAKLVKEMVYD